MDRYEPEKVEAKWRPVWEAERAFHVDNRPPGTPRNPSKRYVLEQLPYPSGSLHMGHMLVYTIGDVRAHFYRRNGYEVMRPMGFDSFGLPAENAAIKGGGHPRVTTERNIAAIRTFMKRVGWAIDWERELSTHDPGYYRWTQWLFLKLLEAGLAYRKEAPVKWCPNDQTVLANEQVKDGRCERCGAVVESRNLEQWFFKTTAYADELLDFEGLRWPDRIVAMQRNWIGRSEGADVLFRIEELDLDLPVFTTRPDTLYGATFFVVAPEHPIVDRLGQGSPHEKEIREYVRRTAARGRGRRRATGSATGASRASATGAVRSRSSIAAGVESCRFRTRTCRCCCRTSRTTCRRGSRRSRPTRSGCACPALGAAARRGARRRRWTRSSTPPGTSCATAIRTTTASRSRATSSTTGALSTSTRAGSTTRRCT